MRQVATIYYPESNSHKVFIGEELFSSPISFFEAVEDYKRACAKVMLSSMEVVKCG